MVTGRRDAQGHARALPAQTGPGEDEETQLAAPEFHSSKTLRSARKSPQQGRGSSDPNKPVLLTLGGGKVPREDWDRRGDA